MNSVTLNREQSVRNTVRADYVIDYGPRDGMHSLFFDRDKDRRSREAINAAEKVLKGILCVWWFEQVYGY